MLWQLPGVSRIVAKLFKFLGVVWEWSSILVQDIASSCREWPHNRSTSPASEKREGLPFEQVIRFFHAGRPRLRVSEAALEQRPIL